MLWAWWCLTLSFGEAFAHSLPHKEVKWTPKFFFIFFSLFVHTWKNVFGITNFSIKANFPRECSCIHVRKYFHVLCCVQFHILRRLNMTKTIDYQQIQHIEHRYYTSDIGLAFHCPGVRKNLDKIEFCMLNKNFENFCVNCS